MAECYCDDDDAWEFHRSKRPIATKNFKCSECSLTIHPGERYENVSGKANGKFDVFRTCCFCLAIRDLMETRIRCFCWAHEHMLEDCEEELEYHNPPGLKFAIGRILVEKRRMSSIGRA
jgi:hypothetical protein